MLSLVLGSPPAPMRYCRVHQRAWVTSLDRWVTFHVPTRDGNPSTDVPCDLCRTLPRGGEVLGEHREWRGARAGHDHGAERWSATAYGTHEPA
jgi:hypothetical protein